MQEEVTQKTIALSMKTGKLTAQALQFLAGQTKSAANTLCIREHFCDSCRKICKRGDA